MGNKPAYQAIEIDEALDGVEFISKQEEATLLKNLTYFDRRFDYRFGKPLLYRNPNNFILAKIKHKFLDYDTFLFYLEKYQFRESLSNNYLMKILFLYTTRVLDLMTQKYIINLVIQYPYNDLKNEINARIIDGQEFTEYELMKILRAGVSSLYYMQSQGYGYQFVLNQHSVCFFEKPNGKQSVQILEFSNLENESFNAEPDFNELYQSNCRYLAIILIEAGLLLNKMLIYENVSEFFLLRSLDDFSTKYKNNSTLVTIVDQFMRPNCKLTLDQAYQMVFDKRSIESQRYIFENNKIIINEKIKRTSKIDAEKLKLALLKKNSRSMKQI